MKNYKITVLKGEGIGPEIVDECIKVLNAAGEKFGFELCKTQYVKDIDLHNYFMVRKPQKND